MGRWAPIPRIAIPSYDSMEWDLVDEETALRVIGDPERFDDERGPDPEATRPRRRRRR